jgi:hypothetical protein
VDVYESRRDEQPRGIDLVTSGTIHPAHGYDPIAIHRNIATSQGVPSAVGKKPVANDEVVADRH